MYIVCMNINHILLKSEWLGKSIFWEGPVAMGGFTKQILELTTSIWPCPGNELGWGPWGAKHTLVYVPTSSHPHSHWDGECYNRRKSCFHVFLSRIWSENLEFKWNLSQFPLCSFLSLTLGSLPWRTTFCITSRHGRCSSRMRAAFVGVKGGTY